MDAAALRRRRERAAALLADSPLRDQLAWGDLVALPEWALAERAALDRLACATGVRAHVASLRQCIDGRVLQRVRKRLGDAALQRLLAGEEVRGAPPLLDPVDLDPITLDRLVAVTGRDWLLASVERLVLSDALRQRLWPDAPPLLRVVRATTARAAVEAAIAAIAATAATAAIDADDSGSTA